MDAHVHLLPARLAAAIRRFFERHMSAWSLPYPDEPMAARAALVDAGITRCWTLPYAHKAGMAPALNRAVAALFAADTVVVAGGTVHPGDDVAAVVREALDELHLRVLKLHCSVGGFQADDARLDPLWSRVSLSGEPVVVHAGHAVDGTTTAAEIAEIARVAERWPEARIVLAHLGAPAVDAGLTLLRTTRAVHADLTPVGAVSPAVTRAALAGIEDRLLFGSDAPNTGLRIDASVAHVRALGLAPAAEQAILGGTAMRLVPA